MFRELSIRNKLALVLWGTALMVYALAGVGLAVFYNLTQERRVRQIMEPYAHLVSVGTDAAVAFEDPVRAQEILNTLQSNGQILEADITLHDGRVLAVFSRKHPPPSPPVPKRVGIYLQDDTAELFQNLPQGARLHLSMSLDRLRQQTHQAFWLFGAGMLALLAVTLGQLMVLQRTIVRPLATLTEAAELFRIQDGQRPSYCVPASGADEVGRLGQSFNAMLEAVQAREDELRESEQRYRQLNETLEQRIAQAVEELQQKTRMLVIQSRQAVMGEMISNIAHQWRQPLNTLGLLAQELQMTRRAGQLSQEFADANSRKTLEIIKHMSKTIDDFRFFFRPSKEKEDFRAREILDKTLSLLEASMTEHRIRIEIEAKGDPVVTGYPNEFSQVLLNIISNARDAFAARSIPDPMVTIRLYTEGEKTVVTVTDNAGGIPEEIIDKVFDPYFSTKGHEQGTGIGLYMCKTIIEKNMNGTIGVRNVGTGAEFRIEL